MTRSVVCGLALFFAVFVFLPRTEAELRVCLPDAVPVEIMAREEPYRAIVERELEVYSRDGRGVAREVTPELFLSLISVESSGNPNAASSHGAIGLTQVMPKWHLKALRDAGIIAEEGELFDASANIKAGLYVLMGYARRSSTLTEALSRYNAGRVCPAGVSYARKVIEGAGK